MAKSIQEQLAEKLKAKYPNAEVKKVNKDNFLDIHLPGVHPKRGTHLFFNTSGGSIKVGFYCREEEFTSKILSKNASLEAYSQGIRPKGNPEWKTVDAACDAAFTFVESLSGNGNKEQKAPTKQSSKPKKEKPVSSKTEDLTDFDLTEFDLDGRAVGKKDAPKASSQKGKPADTSLADASDRCLDDPQTFLTCIQQLRNYYLALSSNSNNYRGTYEEILREFTKAAVVPRISNEMLRIAHEDGNLIEALLLGPMLQAEEIYDKNFVTHNDYVRSLNEVISDLLGFCNEGLFLDTLEFFMYLGDELDEDDSPSGSLNAQDRYFLLFLMLKASSKQSPDNLKMVLNKGANSRNARNGGDVKNLVLKASGNFNQLSNEEKLGLILYDFILWDEPDAGLDIKLGDISAARSIFAKVTQNASLGEQLIGGFGDNASFEIFQFFNVEYNRAGFHTFCLERWKELSSEWNKGILQVLLDKVKKDFHPSTYTNNPVLEDYLEIFGGVRVLDLSGYSNLYELSKLKENQEKDVQEADFPKMQKALPKGKGKKKSQTHDGADKSLDIPSLMHSILFVILEVGWKFDNYSLEEIADIKSTAVSLGDWFDMDQDECLDALDETLDLLKKCKTTFSIEEISNSMIKLCLHIHRNVTNEAAREDIIRFMNDRANADGKLTEEEKTDLVLFSNTIEFGNLLYGEE